MDFRRVLDALIAGFRAESVDYALIGGFALALWGVQRATVDLDFLVHRDSLPAVDRLMEGLGYRCRYRTENVSQFVADEGWLGAVDYLHAFRAASVDMLSGAVDRQVFGGALRVRVVRPEDLVGLKVQALHNDPRREPFDADDIRKLFRLHGQSLDWARVESYFALFGREALCQQLRREGSP
jgi:hypothetical protein